MLHGVTVPLAIKICAAVAVTGGAGVATYQVADLGDKEPATIVIAGENEIPERLALGDEKATTTTTVAPLSEGESGDTEEAGDEVVQAAEPVEAPDTEAPEIVILSPEADSHHDDKIVLFKGETEPGATVKAGPYQATVDEKGNWKIELVLSEGANTATITATDEAGNVGTATVTVWLDVQETAVNEAKDDKESHDKESHDKEADEKDEAADVAFTANQKYGFCELAEPYEVFWGTAAPNSKVTISSPYGSATAEVNKDGHWEKKVYFDGAPIGQPFTITVTGTNGAAAFEFTAKAPPTDDEKKSETGDLEGHESKE